MDPKETIEDKKSGKHSDDEKEERKKEEVEKQKKKEAEDDKEHQVASALKHERDEEVLKKEAEKEKHQHHEGLLDKIKGALNEEVRITYFPSSSSSFYHSTSIHFCFLCLLFNSLNFSLSLSIFVLFLAFSTYELKRTVLQNIFTREG